MRISARIRKSRPAITACLERLTALRCSISWSEICVNFAMDFWKTMGSVMISRSKCIELFDTFDTMFC